MGIMQDNLCHPYILSTTVLSDSGGSRGFLGFRGTPLFVVLCVCVVGLVSAHERSGKRNPTPFQNPRSTTDT